MEEQVKEVKKYPLVEDMTFRAYVTSEQEALDVLTSVQAIINAVGGQTIIALVKYIEKNPNVMKQALTYLPLIMR